ncbi:MAG: molecular chaperone HtpG [Spirochaetaceae bacterium]|nr:MAG: molecular chaperone HtpG [Spirochaetaceae bacterium]
MAKQKFKTEVGRLLHLITHSLYSHPEVFLRELISNASDAIDRLKYLTLTNDEFKGFAFVPRIDISFDQKDKSWLTVADTGIGMNGEELAKNLGTIANSGTRQFVESLGDQNLEDTNLIGQFGVGFYSAFMVADNVEVISKKAGEEQAYKWLSDGKGSFSVEEATAERNGTTVRLFLSDRGKEYANRWQIESIVKKYSNHIPFPIYLHFEEVKSEGEGDKKKEKREQKVEQVNSASALWRRPKNELKDEDYNEFYRTISHDTEDPLHFVHTKAEGALEYTTLFYIPKKAPFDLFFVNYKPGVKLYVKRVFITDDEKELLPTYLRFIQGIIDSEDLPLNVSREMLQENQILQNIRNASIKKILGELDTISQNTPEKYEEFYEQFGVCLKEGVYQDFSNREALLELLRYKSTTEKGLTSLKGYKERMGGEQKAIYYITGGSEDKLRNSPLLETYKQRGLEVLIMDHEIDELVAPVIGRYKDVELKSVGRSGTAEDLKTDADKEKEKEINPLLKKIKKILGDEVKDVRASTRLSDSPSCIVADDNDPTIQMQHIFKALGQKDLPEVKPILEINPDHAIVKKLSGTEDKELTEDISRLLFEQALIVEGAELAQPAEFAKRLNRVIAKSL